MIGSTIAHYKITAKLGEGGMGEVYRARDERLNRDVAVKLLPQSVQDDPARLARFKREAQVLASLTHGNIAQVYGLEEQDGHHAIVLELVEGEDLSERLARGPIPLEEAREIATQIAEALEAAHEKGIVHRDLKPANVKLAPDGTVKVLDFGLAKALVADAAEGEISNSPTLTAAATQAGVILGTAAYMAPEQAKGKPVDRRADVWAFGCVLYEMLTGRAPFNGDGVSEVLAHVITREPDLSALPKGLPASLRDLLQRCLRKDPRKRVPDIAVARIALQELDETNVDPERREPARPPKGVLTAWWLPGFVGLAVGLALMWFALSEGTKPAAPLEGPTHFDLVLDPLMGPQEIALSPDGKTLIYQAKIDGVQRFYKRRLDAHESEVVPGSENGANPFFSPDGREIGFFTAGQLRRVTLDGGLPETLIAAPGRVTSAYWDTDGTIVYGTSATVVPQRVEARAGAAPTPIRINDLTPDTGVHAARPLPGGKMLLTFETGAGGEARVVWLDPATGDWKPLLPGQDARFVPPDRLLYVQQGRVMVTAFDPRRGEVSGSGTMADLFEPALTRIETVERFHAALAADGTLVYPSGTVNLESRLVRISASGETTDTGLTGVAPQVDSKGRRAVACPRDSSVHVLDLVDRTDTPLTFLDTSWYPMWSHDDSQILFADRRLSSFATWTVAPDGSGQAKLLFDDQLPNTLTTSEGPDGTFMGYVVDPLTFRDIWIRRPGGTTEMILKTPANERVPILSPDGRWFAYLSNESGVDQLYLRDVEALERRWQLSTDGGDSPVWSRDGSRLYFLRGESIYFVTVRTEGGVRVGEETLFVTVAGIDRDDWGNQTFDSMPDGGLLVSVAARSEVVPRVVLGWRGQL